jgi:membrane protein DedA with SNARE-associated domain
MEAALNEKAALVPRSRYLLVAAMAALVVGALQATDLVELPFAAWFSVLTGSTFSAAALGGFMSEYGYASLFVLMSLESASLPIPSEVVLPFAGYMVYVGAMSFWPVVAVSTLAGIVGALADYYAAVWLGRPFVIGVLRVLRLHKGALDQAERWFARSGQWTVFAARFVPGLRGVISIPAGLFRMGLKAFVLMTALGCVAWSAILVYAGLVAGPGWSSAFSSSTTLVDALSGLVAATAAVYIAYYAYPRLRPRRAVAPSPASVS